MNTYLDATAMGQFFAELLERNKDTTKETAKNSTNMAHSIYIASNIESQYRNMICTKDYSARLECCIHTMTMNCQIIEIFS